MTEQQIVIAALSRFSDWAEPGTYIPRVLAEPSLDEVSKRVVSEIWEEANDPKYWVEPSFNSAPELLRQGLRTSYPWLDISAIENLMRGASTTGNS